MCEESLGDLQNELIPLVSKLLSAPEPLKTVARDKTLAREDSSTRISLCNFSDGDTLIFFPTPSGDFLAFNVNTPHHYLINESKALIGQDKHFKKAYVLGKLVMKEQKVSSAEYNPFKLPIGVTFFEVYVESVTAALETFARKESLAAAARRK